MFSTGSTVTNKYFEALLNALIELKKIEQNGFKYSENTDRQSELEYIINDFPDGSLEGAKLLVTHYIYERDKRLSLCAKRIARECHPEKLLECEICGIIPEKEYKLDLIQADHRTPLNQLNKQTNVMPKDFAMLCPNCHRAVHKTENCEIFEVVRKLNDLKL
jgi:putative restriction endonuclease